MTNASQDFMGFRAIHLGNGVVRAAIVPDVGGRVLQFWLGDHAYLSVNRDLAGRLFSAEQNWGDGTIAS
jgi:galactose mutarotase-like enzyme